MNRISNTQCKLIALDMATRLPDRRDDALAVIDRLLELLDWRDDRLLEDVKPVPVLSNVVEIR